MAQRYAHAPRPTAAPITFKLEGTSLTVDSGRKVDIVQLGAVEQVRLTYEPRSFAQRSFQTKVRMKDGKTFKFSSLNWQSLIQAESKGAEYSAFARTLLKAIAQANPQARLYAGRPTWAWVVTAILGFGSIVAIMIFVWRALQSGATSAALLGGVIGVAGIWQLEPMIRLNRPAEFDPNDPPPALLPNT
jgi:hypothetical protein